MLIIVDEPEEDLPAMNSTHRRAALLAGVALVATLITVPPQADAEPPLAALLTEAEAMQQATTTGQPVQVTALTTETQLIEALPTGDFRATITALPERVQNPEGEWEDIDLTLESSGGRLEPVAALGGATLEDGGGNLLARIEDGQNYFSLTWPTTLPTPVVDGENVLYPDVLPGVDLVARTTAGGGIATYVVVKTPAAAQHDQIRTLTYGWSASPGLTLDASINGLTVTNAAGDAVFKAPGLAMWDSSTLPVSSRTPLAAALEGGDGNREQLDAHVDGNTLQIPTNSSYFEAPSTVYPVVIDPSVDRPYHNWAMVWSNGQTFIGSTTEHARVGYDGWSDNKISRAYYNFDILAVKGKVIKTATLVHRNIHSPNWTCNLGSNGPGVNLYTSQPILSTISWSNQPSALVYQGVSNTAHGHSSVCPGYSRAEWPVTAGVVASQASGALTVMLKSADETNREGWRQYDNIVGSLPAVTIEYATTPNTPLGVIVAERYNRTPYTAAKTVTLSAQVTSADTTDNKVYARFAMTGVSTTYQNSGYVTGSGTVSISWVPPAEGLYALKVSACSNNGGGCSPLSTAYNLTVDWTKPAAPTISGDTTPQASTATSYTIKSTSSDTIEYKWGVANPPTTTVTGTSTGITVSLKPPFGPSSIYAYAIDRAGNQSTTRQLDIKAGGKQALAHRYTFDAKSGADTGDTLIPLPLTANATLASANWVQGSYVQPYTNTGQAFAPGGGTLALINTSSDTGLDTRDPFTISAWVYPTDADLTGQYSIAWLTNKSDTIAFCLGITNGYWTARVGDQTITGPAAAPNDWQYVGVSYDGSGRADLYVLGIDTQHVSTTVAERTGSRFGIGASPTKPAINGAVDHLRIWSTYQARAQFNQTSTEA